MKTAHWLAMSLVVGWCLSASAATIEGMVRLPKAIPPPAMPSRYQNKTPGRVGPPPPPVAVVYLEGQFPAGPNTNPGGKAEMEQKHFQFGSRVLPVRTGSVVEFPNRDEGDHSVYSNSDPKTFDLGRYRKNEKATAILFDKPGMVQLYCEIHPHMRATILVLDSPFFVTTDAQGKYRLANLPAGKYKLKAWVNEKVVWEKPVVLEETTNLRVDFPGANGHEQGSES